LQPFFNFRSFPKRAHTKDLTKTHEKPHLDCLNLHSLVPLSFPESETRETHESDRP
jgi:hypothetical protein